MARVLIVEPSDEIRDLLHHVVSRLGHEAVDYDGSPLPAADVVILEPAAEEAQLLAERLQREQPELALVCVSVYPRELMGWNITCAAYVQKPFAQRDIAQALRSAL